MTSDDIWEAARHALRNDFHQFNFLVEIPAERDHYHTEEALANDMGLRVERLPCEDLLMYRFGTMQLHDVVQYLCDRASRAIAAEWATHNIWFWYPPRWGWDTPAMRLVLEEVHDRLGVWRLNSEYPSNIVKVVPND